MSSNPQRTRPAPTLTQRQKELQQAMEHMSSRFSRNAKDDCGRTRITDQEFRELRDYIYSRSGIAIPTTRKYLLENRLSSRLRSLQLQSFGEYLAHLKRAADKGREESMLFELVTTNETSFYRNTAQLDVFQHKVLPEILEAKRAARDCKLHIWSAGCSTGEEPYTLSIMLHEVLGAELARWRVSISAHDLSLAVLKAAKDGIYGDYALRTTPKEVLKKHFKQDGDRFQVLPHVKRLVRFAPINLNDAAQMRRVERADVIFCRNVIIYFDEDMKKRVLRAFEERLTPDGYLFIGHSETLHNITDAFDPIRHPGAIVYQKKRETLHEDRATRPTATRHDPGRRSAHR